MPEIRSPGYLTGGLQKVRLPRCCGVPLFPLENGCGVAYHIMSVHSRFGLKKTNGPFHSGEEQQLKEKLTFQKCYF